MPSVLGELRGEMIVRFWMRTLLYIHHRIYQLTIFKHHYLIFAHSWFNKEINEKYMNTDISAHSTRPASKIFLLQPTDLQYTGWMVQKGEFKKVKFAIIISCESCNSTRCGRVKSSVLLRNQPHQTAPWPSIVPLSPESDKWVSILKLESKIFPISTVASMSKLKHCTPIFL